MNAYIFGGLIFFAVSIMVMISAISYYTFLYLKYFIFDEEFVIKNKFLKKWTCDFSGELDIADCFMFSFLYAICSMVWSFLWPISTIGVIAYSLAHAARYVVRINKKVNDLKDK